eukprot:TRINITY_DN16372_c0_g1::TRINITY_DN16372_c0_g1_i1::g.29468::m.29468 TRINITY_DN16372_c0_g1::TRINITY_DN16372_c0_g1_i1::g.29468  ORF type:complete len:182 (-),score=4.06 TRINITY_DN16372_c0_g1_i1:20-565(-)
MCLAKRTRTNSSSTTYDSISPAMSSTCGHPQCAVSQNQVHSPRQATKTSPLVEIKSNGASSPKMMFEDSQLGLRRTLSRDRLDGTLSRIPSPKTVQRRTLALPSMQVVCTTSTASDAIFTMSELPHLHEFSKKRKLSIGSSTYSAIPTHKISSGCTRKPIVRPPMASHEPLEWTFDEDQTF